MSYMSNTPHAQARIRERLGDAGFDPITIGKVFDAAQALARRSTADSEAIRLLRLDSQVNTAYGERSNGDNLWAIIRNGRLATMMLRRSNQPSTTTALRVDKVTII